jgi:hypothetical protein
MKAAPAPVNPVADLGRWRHVVQMTAKDKEREERLAAALRENLRKRKGQARATEEKKKPQG